MTSLRKRSDAFTEADVGDEVILMRLDNGELLSLTDTGAAVWRLIDGSRDAAAIAALLAEEYDADPAAIDNDVRLLLSQLNEAGLIAAD